MAKTCSTCVWWETFGGGHGICGCEKYSTKYIKDGDGFCAIDGYAYGGGGTVRLRTGPNFGCIHHKSGESEEKLAQQ